MLESERSEERLAKEAQLLLGGGTASTARTIGFATVYILSDPKIRARLEQELREPMAGWPDRVPTWAELERLPFLQALIKESLRLSYAVMHRLPRVSPDVPVKFVDKKAEGGKGREWVIPPGTPVGMSIYLMHSDPEVYERPDEFVPERWVDGNVTPAMVRNYVPFCKGSRNCLGQK